MEMIVKTDQYQQAWSTIMPKLSEYTFINHEPDEELDEETFNSLEEGKKHLVDVHCFYKSCTFYNYILQLFVQLSVNTTLFVNC